MFCPHLHHETRLFPQTRVPAAHSAEPDPQPPAQPLQQAAAFAAQTVFFSDLFRSLCVRQLGETWGQRVSAHPVLSDTANTPQYSSYLEGRRISAWKTGSGAEHSGQRRACTPRPWDADHGANLHRIHFAPSNQRRTGHTSLCPAEAHCFG